MLEYNESFLLSYFQTLIEKLSVKKYYFLIILFLVICRPILASDYSGFGKIMFAYYIGIPVLLITIPLTVFMLVKKLYQIWWILTIHVISILPFFVTGMFLSLVDQPRGDEKFHFITGLMILYGIICLGLPVYQFIMCLKKNAKSEIESKVDGLT